MNYYEKLKDPRWQKIRLLVMKREKFTCERCKSKTKSLNIHHGYYEKYLDPWEYEPRTLHCLCNDCHEIIQKQTVENYKLLSILSIKKFENLLFVALNPKKTLTENFYKLYLKSKNDKLKTITL